MSKLMLEGSKDTLQHLLNSLLEEHGDEHWSAEWVEEGAA